LVPALLENFALNDLKDNKIVTEVKMMEVINFMIVILLRPYSINNAKERDTKYSITPPSLKHKTSKAIANNLCLYITLRNSNY
jgi:hypothetical protein